MEVTRDNKLAIIILNYMNYDLTIKCVENLIALNTNYNIVIVDNKSPNDSFKILLEKFKEIQRVEIIESKENKGYAYGNNIGIKYAINYLNCKHICIMNPDIIVDNSGIFKDLISVLNQKKLAGITALPITNGIFEFPTIGWKIPKLATLLIANCTVLSRIWNPISYKSLKTSGNRPIYGEIDVMPGCFFILDSDFIKKVGYLDENTFLYYEENILALKAKKNNDKFGISFNHYYFHNHESKDNELRKFKKKFKDRKIIFSSQTYYAKNYLNLNLFKQVLLKFSQMFNLYIEMPILHGLKKALISLKK